MHKNGRPRVLGDTVPVMKEMKEKNLHRGPRAPGVCNRWGRVASGPGGNSVSYQLLEKWKKKYHLFHPHGGRVRPLEKPKNKSIILVKLLFHRKRKVSSRRFGVRSLSGGRAQEKNERKCIISPRHECTKMVVRGCRETRFQWWRKWKKKTFIGPRAPAPAFATAGAGCIGGRGKFCILSTFRKMKEKSIICFIRTVGRVRPLEKPKNKSIILVKLLFHLKRKVSSRPSYVRKRKKKKEKKREEPGKSIDYTPKVREKAQSNGKKGRAIWAPQK
jgi:hypothetical protein